MDDHTRQRLELIEGILHEMIRDGSLTYEALERVALRFDSKAHLAEGSERSGFYQQLATAARAMPWQATAPTESDHRAAHRRRQMRERAHLTAVTGGKTDP